METKKSFTGFEIRRETKGYTLSVHLPMKTLPNGSKEYQDSLDYVYESLPKLKKQVKGLLDVISEEDSSWTVNTAD